MEPESPTTSRDLGELIHEETSMPNACCSGASRVAKLALYSVLALTAVTAAVAYATPSVLTPVVNAMPDSWFPTTAQPTPKSFNGGLDC